MIVTAKKLEELILSGQEPEVFNASSVGYPSVFTFHHLDMLGWTTKTYTHDAEGEVDGWIRYYSGPKPFMLRTCGAPEPVRILPNSVIE